MKLWIYLVPRLVRFLSSSSSSLYKTSDFPPSLSLSHLRTHRGTQISDRKSSEVGKTRTNCLNDEQNRPLFIKKTVIPNRKSYKNHTLKRMLSIMRSPTYATKPRPSCFLTNRVAQCRNGRPHWESFVLEGWANLTARVRARLLNGGALCYLPRFLTRKHPILTVMPFPSF